MLLIKLSLTGVEMDILSLIPMILSVKKFITTARSWNCYRFENLSSVLFLLVFLCLLLFITSIC